MKKMIIEPIKTSILRTSDIQQTSVADISSQFDDAPYEQLLPIFMPDGLLLSLVRDTLTYNSGESYSSISDKHFAGFEHVMKLLLNGRSKETGKSFALDRMNLRTLAITMDRFYHVEVINRTIGRFDDNSEEVREAIDDCIRSHRPISDNPFWRTPYFKVPAKSKEQVEADHQLLEASKRDDRQG